MELGKLNMNLVSKNKNDICLDLWKESLISKGCGEQTVSSCKLFYGSTQLECSLLFLFIPENKFRLRYDSLPLPHWSFCGPQLLCVKRPWMVNWEKTLGLLCWRSEYGTVLKRNNDYLIGTLTIDFKRLRRQRKQTSSYQRRGIN